LFGSAWGQVLPAEESNKAISDCETAAAPRLQCVEHEAADDGVWLAPW